MLGLNDAGGGQQVAHHLGVEGLAPFGGSPGFLVEDRGNFSAAVARPVQVARACHQSGVSAECLQPSHGSYERVGRPVPAMPAAFFPRIEK